MSAKAATKGGIAEALSASAWMKKSVCGEILNSLAEVATQGLRSTGVFTIPRTCEIEARMKPASKAGRREVFGKVVVVKARSVRKVVKASPVSALKGQKLD